MMDFNNSGRWTWASEDTKRISQPSVCACAAVYCLDLFFLFFLSPSENTLPAEVNACVQ